MLIKIGLYGLDKMKKEMKIEDSEIRSTRLKLEELTLIVKKYFPKGRYSCYISNSGSCLDIVKKSIWGSWGSPVALIDPDEKSIRLYDEDCLEDMTRFGEDNGYKEMIKEF